MDVRCESCHTEYELDDGKVNEGGTDVQCTFCGHTFVVFPPAATARPVGAETEFLLATADGRTQRLRDLTVLQKWIIERRVTRTDKISKNGQAFVRLGALEDLAPFFDVVDEADRARAAIGRSMSSESLPARATGGFTIPTSGEGGGLGRSTPHGERAVNRSLELMAVEAPVTPPEADLTLVPAGANRGWWKLLVTFGVAAAVAYAGIRMVPLLVGAQEMGSPPPGVGRVSHFVRQTADQLRGRGSARQSEVVVANPPAVAAPAAPAPAAPEPAAVAAPAAAAPSVPPVAPGARGVTAVTGARPGTGTTGARSVAEPAVAPAVVTTAKAAAPAVESAAKPVVPAAAPAAPKPAPRPRVVATEEPTYERLVAQADHLLENGANERALKLYERALTLRPNAPEALTGIGYVHLDRNRVASAIEFFTKASAASPYAPAMFGLGQAHRAAGDPGRARETYKRYLSLFPTGAEAAVAERQLRALNEGAAEVSVPSSILQEGKETKESKESKEPTREPAKTDSKRDIPLDIVVPTRDAGVPLTPPPPR